MLRRHLSHSAYTKKVLEVRPKSVYKMKSSLAKNLWVFSVEIISSRDCFILESLSIFLTASEAKQAMSEEVANLRTYHKI